jgi:phage terminase large subunit-like protein
MKNKQEQIEHLKLLETFEKKIKYNKLNMLFPSEGKYRKDLYPKHLRFFEAGSKHKQRLLCGGNRTGKTLTGGCELTYHLTGLYPDDWKGRKFLNPIKSWAVSKSYQVSKEVQQLCLMGDFNDPGSGLIPKHLIVNTTRRVGIANCYETVYVRHISGLISECTFKVYEQGRDDFQGTAKDVIWMDEEPRDYGIYEECLMRTMDDIKPGIIYMTFTPLFGLSEMVLSFLKGGRFTDDGINPDDPAKWAIQISWDEAPHLSEEQKSELMHSISPHLRDARTKGLPHLGAGVIYPYSEDDILIRPREIPFYWPKAYGLDVGWERTAAIWAALDPDSGIYYLYSEYYRGKDLSEVGTSVIPIHSSAIKSRGNWIPGVIDTASLRSNELDGRCIYDQYVNEGLELTFADKAVEAGIMKIQQLLAAGRIKVFDTLTNWINEFRTYRRDEKSGKPAEKQEDHLMDAWRYLMMACPDILSLEPDPDNYSKFMGRNHEHDNITGY